MRSEFQAGFVKRASEAGYSEQEVASLWKAAYSLPEGKTLIDSIPESSNPLSIERLVALSQIKQAMEKKEEVERLKEHLKSVCA